LIPLPFFENELDESKGHASEPNHYDCKPKPECNKRRAIKKSTLRKNESDLPVVDVFIGNIENGD